MKSVKSSLRRKADKIKEYRCKNLVVVLEEPDFSVNIGTVIRNINALGAEKLYVIDSKGKLPNDWHEMREQKSLLRASSSAIKWSFVKVFENSKECIEHLNKNHFVSITTSPHLKGKKNIILHEGDYTEHKKLAVWFGNESRGISEIALENCSACIQIEMFGIVESLNLATSSGIVLYEITKQRRAFQEAARKKPIDNI